MFLLYAVPLSADMLQFLRSLLACVFTHRFDSRGGLHCLGWPVRRLHSTAAAKYPRSCAGNQLACNVIRELLRALGGCLIAIGAAVGVLANSVDREHDAYALTLIIILVLPSEGMNAVGMYRVRSPFFMPLIFILLTLVGVALGLLGS
jgi:hypothetical protein